MNIVPFADIYLYFSNKLTQLSAEMYNASEITEDLQYKFFPSTGEYLNEVNNPNFDEKEYRTVLVNIMNTGGSQDTTLSVDAYIQAVSINVLALDEQRDDIVKVFTRYATENKSIIDNIEYKVPVYESGNYITDETKTSTINITIGELPVYSERFHAMGHDKFSTTLSFGIVILPSAQLSNAYTLSINGYNIKYNTVKISRVSEMMSDLRKREESKFFANTTGFVLSAGGIFVSDNSALNDLLLDCCTNNAFNQKLSIQLAKPDGTVLINSDFKIKDSTFDLTFGKLINWSMTLYPAVDI